jgi:hypothetical protein
VTAASETLYEEVSYVAYHFHWGLDEIMDLEHPVRRRFVDQIARMTSRQQRSW